MAEDESTRIDTHSSLIHVPRNHIHSAAPHTEILDLNTTINECMHASRYAINNIVSTHLILYGHSSRFYVCKKWIHICTVTHTHPHSFIQLMLHVC